MIPRGSRRALGLVGALLLGAACAPQAQEALPAAEAPPWRLADADSLDRPDHLILTVPLDDPEALAAVAAEIERRYGVRLAAEWPLNAIAVHCLVIDASGIPDVDALIEAMRADARIRTVQRMQSFQVLALHYGDPLFPAQTALALLNAPRAHQGSTGAGVRVGVVDSAIDARHSDLAPRLADARDFVAREPGEAAEAHGTAVASLIAAEADNARGIVGVAPGVDLVGLRACWQREDGGGSCSSFSLARALNFAILNRIRVLNLSLGGPPDPLLAELVEKALADGAVVIAAWGEQARPAFPASMPGVIAAGGAQGGRGLPAPEVDVISAAPGEAYNYVSGSSVATAHVAGVAALLLAARPELTSAEISHALSSSVVLRDGQPTLDACEALRAVNARHESCSG
ncbi:S8 family peptidase [Albimonas pacifica]|uniref:Serine protease, subtilisin family n=1 Tax=Albimonas pacifica TaxID=1114924 RepID=A0A1I3BM03_9RHOB|nr:S8 family serine peptidase [Albimonas pacifica]SFH62959.1 Serine protease, subtilisin family [Albimonas pacifica]